MQIIVDTREQKPFLFKAYPDIKINFDTLKTGDYSLLNHETRFCIERKSLPDLFQTLSRGRKRFKAEFLRMQEMAGACLVIEADSFYDIFKFSQNNRYSKMNPKSIWHTLLAWGICYKIPVYFIGIKRDVAEKNIYNILKLWDKFK